MTLETSHRFDPSSPPSPESSPLTSPLGPKLREVRVALALGTVARPGNLVAFELTPGRGDWRHVGEWPKS